MVLFPFLTLCLWYLILLVLVVIAWFNFVHVSNLICYSIDSFDSHLSIGHNDKPFCLTQRYLYVLQWWKMKMLHAFPWQAWQNNSQEQLEDFIHTWIMVIYLFSSLFHWSKYMRGLTCDSIVLVLLSMKLLITVHSLWL